MVIGLRELGQRVAFVGSSSLDTPSLKAADLSICAGSGSDVAKDASDVIILDDNFVSIMKCIMWGRNVFAGLRKLL